MTGKIIAAAIVTAAVLFGHSVQANAPQTPDEKTAVKESHDGMPPAVIDDIAVPFKVMVYVETKYPGHTVTKAQKIIYKSKPAYRLRVDRDSMPDDYDSIYLIYDSKWKLLDDSKMSAPTPVLLPIQPAPEPKPANNQTEEQPKERAGSGIGGGDGSYTENRDDSLEKPVGDDKPAEDEKPADDSGDSSGSGQGSEDTAGEPTAQP